VPFYPREKEAEMLKRSLLALVLVCASNRALASTCTSPEGSAGVNVVNLTSPGATGTANGALFEQISAQSTGSGVIDPFVRINPGGSDNCEQGYNTSHRKLEFDENNSPTFTHDLALADVPVVTKGGIDYYQFLLDINQNNNGPTDHFLSLNKIEIYSSGFAGATGYPGGLGALEWSLDGAGPAWIWLDYALNHGSGSGDMFMYVPKSMLSGTYVYFYSSFGEDFNANDGYEEWAVLRAGPVPTPTPSPSPAPSPTPNPSPSPGL
jgi:hypothetical protein